MSGSLDEDRAGLPFGTAVRMKPLSIENSEAWLTLTGAACAPITLTFDRAGHNTWDGAYAYCFELP